MTVNHSTADRDHRAVVDRVDAEPFGGDRARARRPARAALASSSQRPSAGRASQGASEVGVGCARREALRLVVAHHVVAQGCLVERHHVGDDLDRADAAELGGRFLGEGAVAATEAGRGLDGEEVGAELFDLPAQVGPARLGEPEDRDHRGDPDRDAERGQRSAHLAVAEAVGGDRHDIGGPEPARRHAATACRSGGAGRFERRGHVAPTWRPAAPTRTSAVRRPSRISTRRGSDAAISRSWVMTTIVRPSSWRLWRRSMTAAPDRLSRLPVGSSASTIVGSLTRARATATR